MKTDCDKCKKTAYVGYGPKNQRVSGGYSSGGFHAEGTCVNIIKYKRNECVSVATPIGDGSPVPVTPRPELKCPENLPLSFSSVWPAAPNGVVPPSPGSIIKVTNAPMSYNIVGILNDNGQAFIPSVPLNTKVTFSIYDPVSGLYDTDAGTYTTGSTPGGFDRPILLFQPSTTTRTFTLKIGEVKNDSVSLDMQRIDYMLSVGESDTVKLFNIGFSASAHLSLKIEEPNGNMLFNNINVACYSTTHLRFTKVGTYRIRVAYGSSVQQGSFDLGISYSPDPPLPYNCLCGDILSDTLRAELSPYVATCSSTVLNNDTLATESAVVIEFMPGSSVTANGVLQGVGTQGKPITLKKFGHVANKKQVSALDKIKDGTVKRKEVER